jgi:hypothetical protein
MQEQHLLDLENSIQGEARVQDEDPSVENQSLLRILL